MSDRIKLDENIEAELNDNGSLTLSDGCSGLELPIATVQALQALLQAPPPAPAQAINIAPPEATEVETPAE